MQNLNQKAFRWVTSETDPAESHRWPSTLQLAVESRWRSIWWARLSRSCWADSQAQTPTLEVLHGHKQHDVIHVKSTSAAVTQRSTATLLTLHPQKSCRKPSCYKEGTHQFPNLSDLINYLFNKMIKQKLTYEQQLETEKKTLLFPDDITLTSHIFQKPIALLLRALSWFQDTCIIAFLTVLR